MNHTIYLCCQQISVYYKQMDLLRFINRDGILYYPSIWILPLEYKKKQRTDEHFSQSRKKNKIKKKVKWMLFVKHKLVNTFFDISSKQMKSLFWALVHFYFCYSINLFDGFVLSKVAQEIVKKKKRGRKACPDRPFWYTHIVNYFLYFYFKRHCHLTHIKGWRKGRWFAWC